MTRQQAQDTTENVVYEEGDHVQYQPIGGGNVGRSTTGEVTKVLTSTQPAGKTGVNVKASAEEPRYVIRNDNTGKETAYKEKNIEGTTE